MNEQAIEGRMSRTVAHYERAEEPEPGPVVEGSPIDPEQQTGESRKLGGQMRIRDPWVED